ncbi:MAG: hypothetical protein OEY28_11735 [Nitrospira sp.]|nr:hypothetical protein [Nitrospira sp.]
MKKRYLALTAAVTIMALVTSSSHGQEVGEPESTRVDWRKVVASKDFYVRANEKKDDGLQVSASALLDEFAARAGVAIEIHDRRKLALGRLDLKGSRAATDDPLFDLCQRSLVVAGLTLLPTGDDSFAAKSYTSIDQNVPIVSETALAGRAAWEWILVPVVYRGRNAKAVRSEVRKLVSSPGGSIEMTADDLNFVIIDRAGNMPRVLHLIRQMEAERPPFSLVSYSRATTASINSLAGNLKEFLQAYERETGMQSGTLHLSWDATSAVLVGMVPRSLASMIDSAVDAAETAATRRAAELEAEDKSYVTFVVNAPEGVESVRMESYLRNLFKPEANVGDLRLVVRDEERPEIIVRSRTWLRKDLEDAVAQFPK